MAFNPRCSNNAAKAALNALVGLLDAGAGPGTIEIREGAAPVNVEDAATGNLLGTLTLTDPAFGAAVDTNPGARATANPITSDASADMNGTAGWFRAYDSNGVGVIQGNCAAATADLILNTVTITAGLPIEIVSWVVNMPET